jgi:hypothetical protein
MPTTNGNPTSLFNDSLAAEPRKRDQRGPLQVQKESKGGKVSQASNTFVDLFLRVAVGNRKEKTIHG